MMMEHCRNKTLCLRIVIAVIGFGMAMDRGWAQQTQLTKPGKWVFGLGFTYNQSAVIDNNYSLLMYQGNNLGLSSAINYKGKYAEQELGFSYYSVTAKNKFDKKLDESYFNGNYASLFYINKKADTYNRFKFLAGPNLSVIYNARKYNEFINNDHTFEFASSLGATVEIRCPLNNLVKGLSINNRTSVPLIALLKQPAYGYEGFLLNPHTENQEPIKNTSALLGPQKFFRITNTFTLDKKLFQRHKILLAYTLDYYKISTAREVKKSTNGLGLSYCYLL